MKLIIVLRMAKGNDEAEYTAYDHFPSQGEMEVRWIRSPWLMPPSFDNNLKEAESAFNNMKPGQRWVGWVESNGVVISLQEMPLMESNT